MWHFLITFFPLFLSFMQIDQVYVRFLAERTLTAKYLNKQNVTLASTRVWEKDASAGFAW